MQSPRRSAHLQRARTGTLDLEAYRNVRPRNSGDMPPRVPAPSHRHGTPSGPWPFLDLDAKIDAEKLKNNGPAPSAPEICDHSDAVKCKGCWSGYPQSLFPNWTPAQQKLSKISKIVDISRDTCVVRYVDVNEEGRFSASDELKVTYAEKDAHWEFMRQPRPTGTRLRAMFLENLTGPVLQMIGTKYNVEPFYFSSCLGWIPTRYQEELKPNEGDHITICLTFIRTMRNSATLPPSTTWSTSTESTISYNQREPADQAIDTQAPLVLRSRDQILLPDLLALHMVRSPTGSTIISYHPGQEHKTTTAASLHSRLHGAGHSVYWSSMFNKHNDPTFVFLSILWYALYAWDEASELLYLHICTLESQVIQTEDTWITQELHVIQAHLLHHSSLLEDFRKSVVFVLETPYPALENPSLYSKEEKEESNRMMGSECKNLLREIERLEKSRDMQGKRLRNVMNLVFSNVNIRDSHRMHELAEAAAKDSAAMKQIAYLTMFFLPASLVAAIFGMNVQEINPDGLATVWQYLATAIPMTIITIWVIVAFQFHPGHPRRENAGAGQENHFVNRSMMWHTLGRIGWPIMLLLDVFGRRENSDATSRARVSGV